MIRFGLAIWLNGERRIGMMERKFISCCQISQVVHNIVHMKNEILTTPNKVKIYLRKVATKKKKKIIIIIFLDQIDRSGKKVVQSFPTVLGIMPAQKNLRSDKPSFWLNCLLSFIWDQESTIREKLWSWAGSVFTKMDSRISHPKGPAHSTPTFC